ncbi:SART-1 protein [Auriculariales sp. MPI-PUGE-AT-0066]|nr:SART-1 protein [Auriculariales sp. MPI-PUGE-AT-0066]
MSMEESISLEETNKIRISLGLKPLVDDKAPADTAEAAAEKNYAKQREREKKEAESKRVFDNIAKVKNKRELNAGLKGRTLADLDAGEGDKQEKILAKKRQEELDSMDKAIQDEYTEKDLSGLKVTHDFDELEDGHERILTLKDSRILDNEEDELQNVEMAEHERRQKVQELKIKKPQYTGYDDDEFAGGGIGMKRSVLAKYDEELEGGKDSGFRLGSNAGSLPRAPQTKQDIAETLNRSLLSIDYSKNLEASDYLQAGDKGFKKPKTKKKRANARVVEADPELAVPTDDAMDVDEKKPRRAINLDVNFVDDDDLQASLARARLAKIKKVAKKTPEEIAARIAEERAAEQPAPGVKVEEDESMVPGEGDGLVFDDTSEFVRAISYNPAAPKPVKREAPSQAAISAGQGTPMQVDGDQAITELEAGELKQEEDDDDMSDEEMLDQIESVMKAMERNERADAEANGFEVGTASEQALGTGVITAPSADQMEHERVQKDKDSWLAEQRRRLAQREADRYRIRGNGKDQATREYDNRLREQQEARASAEHFKDYKPDINIVYYDEFGRALTPKEAWKALSHRFHGKMPGRMKQEKRLKRIEEEKRREAMASGDTPLNMTSRFQQRQELAGQAHMVLSVGNRGAVPQAEAFLDQPNLSKKLADKKRGKGDSAVNIGTPDITSFTAAQPLLVSGTASAGASPAPRAGFKRVGSFAPVSSATPAGDATPAPASGAGDGAKVTFGLKRKAADEGQDTPPTKRR